MGTVEPFKINIEITHEEFRLLAAALNTHIRYGSQKVSNSKNAALELKSSLNEFVKINSLLEKLDKTYDTQTRASRPNMKSLLEQMPKVVEPPPIAEPEPAPEEVK